MIRALRPAITHPMHQSSPDETHKRAGPPARIFAMAAIAASLLASLVLLVLYRQLSGPGDQLGYYTQASRLFPFTDNYYGPGYFVAIRLVHDLFWMDWFLAGKVVSWLSACAVLWLSFKLFRRVLPDRAVWLALALVAVNPEVITQSYSDLTSMYGAAWMLAAVSAVASAGFERPRRWIVAGLVFGVAYLTRFQALGLLLGVLAGLAVAPDAPMRRRLQCGLSLLAGTALPVAAWYLLLLGVQGFIPANYNFVHLTSALGEFQSFHDVDELVNRYGSAWGVLTTGDAPVRIAILAAKRAVQFPFTVGFSLLFLAAGWLVPGLVVLAARREGRSPWAVACAVGLVLTGVGSRGWLSYYVAFIPFTVVLIVTAVGALPAGGRWSPRALSWLVILASTLAWTPLAVCERFLSVYWPEFAAARDYMARARDSTTVVTTTAESFRYGTTIPFVDHSAIVRSNETDSLVDRLRQHRVTHLIVSERHTLYEYPELRDLLADSVPRVPLGLRRDTLITAPKRLAIYRVIEPPQR